MSRLCVYARLLLCALLAFITGMAGAQERTEDSVPQPSIETIISEWSRVRDDGDSLGYAIYISQRGPEVDSAEVFFNVHGQPRAWRATVAGIRYAHVPTVGLFVVDDSLAAAFDVYVSRRRLLEALELLQMIEVRVRTPANPTDQP